MCIVVCSSILEGVRINCFSVEWCLIALVVDAVGWVSESRGSGRGGGEWLCGVLNEHLCGTCKYIFALSITKVTGFIHVNPESINRYYLKKVADLGFTHNN